MRRAFLFLVLCAAMVAGGPAYATPNFPGAIQRILSASQPPQCNVCHVCGITGRGTVNTPWGAAVRARGLQAYDEASLAGALAAMERDRVDSNGDGIIDVEEVRTGKDPNPAGTCNPGGDDTIPRYGCVGQMSPKKSGSSPATILMLVVVAAVIVRRRSDPHALLLLAILGSGLTACASGASLAPRPSEKREVRLPAMPSIAPSRMTDELRAIGLDSENLPRFEALSPKQLRRVMSTFTRSLGMACTDCHNTTDYRVPTRAKMITTRMWNEYTRVYGLENGAVYCDSCHQGQSRFLKRGDHEVSSTYMSNNFVDKLKRHDTQTVECETCHGDPADPVIFAKWKTP